MKIKLLLVLSYILSFFLYRQYKQGAVLLITSVTEYLGKNTCPLGPLFKLKNFHGMPDALIRKEDNHQYKLYYYYNHGYYSEVIFVGYSITCSAVFNEVCLDNSSSDCNVQIG